MNRQVTLDVARQPKVFLEVLVAPGFTADALAELKTRKNLRILHLPDCANPPLDGWRYLKQVYGGLLVQDQDATICEKDSIRVVTERQPEEGDMVDSEFALKVVKHVKSNAIVLVKNRQTIGTVPVSPPVTSLRIALQQAGAKAVGSVLASDAFFPFDDCVDAAAAGGVRAIIQPGIHTGSESIDACDKHGVIMLFTGTRHFRH